MYKIIFSATGRTEAIADIICSVFDDVNTVDLSEADFNGITLTEDDLCVVAVPVYGGRVPAPAAENIEKISTRGARAVLVAVYGNRAYDDCLAELKALCLHAGFVPVAACATVAQHSIIPHVATDRPDENDRTRLVEFGSSIKEMYEKGILPADVMVPGTTPKKPRGAMPLHPKADSRCTKCGICAAKCPTGAISVENPSQTDGSKCIACMRCTEICPAGARSFAPSAVKLFGPVMKKVWGKHLENEFFINE